MDNIDYVVYIIHATSQWGQASEGKAQVEQLAVVNHYYGKGQSRVEVACDITSQAT